MSMHGINDGETDKKEQAMLKNRKSTKKKYPERPITGKEWIEGYKQWLKQNKEAIITKVEDEIEKELKKHG